MWLIVSMLAFNIFINKPRQKIKYGEAVSMDAHTIKTWRDLCNVTIFIKPFNAP